MASLQNSSDLFTIKVKAPNQKVTDQTVIVQQNWTIKDLKSHLSEVYPGAPDVQKQKLIYSGKLLSDTLVLNQVLQTSKENPDHIHTMHLVCPNSKPTSNSTRESSASSVTQSSSSVPSSTNVDPTQFLRNRYGLTESDLPRLYQEYYTYLQSFYFQQSCLSWQQPGNGSASGAGNTPSAPSQSSVRATSEQPANEENPAPPAARPPQANNPPAGQAQQPDNAQIGRFFGGMMDAGDAEQEQPRDFLDYIYLAVRIGLLCFIIHYYSSADKVIVAFLLFIVFYVLQRFITTRRHFEFQIHVHPAAPAPPAREERPAQDNERDEQNAGMAEASNPQQDNDTTRQEDANNRPADASRLYLVLDAFRIAIETVFSFFTSLIPDRPPPINVN